MTAEHTIIVCSRKHPNWGRRRVAAETGLSEWLVGKVRREHGFDARDSIHQLTPAKAARIVRFKKNAGKPWAQIARELGVQPSTFRQNVKRARDKGLLS